MDIKFSNNASAYLVDILEIGGTTFSITPGTGIYFPELQLPTDFFFVTVADTDANYEIMKVTSRVGDTFTVIRGQEGTEPQQFTINSIVENRLTAGSIEYILNDTQATPTKEGRVRLATEQDVIDGVSDTMAVTPASLTSVHFMRGMIMPFSGTYDEEGHPLDSRTGLGRKDWHICDGSYYTPDLRGRFILSASNVYPAGTSGGSINQDVSLKVTIDETTLTVDQMPTHTHSAQSAYRLGCGGWFAEDYGNPACGKNTNPSGGSKPHTHTLKMEKDSFSLLPPYYSLSYIMKI